MPCLLDRKVCWNQQHSENRINVHNTFIFSSLELPPIKEKEGNLDKMSLFNQQEICTKAKKKKPKKTTTLN